MEEYFIIAMIGIFAFMFLFIAIFGGRKALGFIVAVISGFTLGISAMAWYSGVQMYSSQLSATTGSAHALVKASLQANNFNGYLSMIIFATLMIIGIILYVLKSKKEVA